MKLWLVRHARTVGGDERCYGRTDLPANAQDTAQAAAHLAQALPRPVIVFASPLSRCTALAQALQQVRPDLQVRTDPRLAEMDFGDWEGRDWSSLEPAALDRWTQDFWTHRPGAGESVQSVFQRVQQALEAARQLPGDVAWITHAGVIRTALLLTAGTCRIDDASQWPAQPIAYGGWTVLDL